MQGACIFNQYRDETMKNLTQRQKTIAKKIKDQMNYCNEINSHLVDACAVLITTAEDAQKEVNEKGVLLTVTGSQKQTKYIENPAVVTRNNAIKQLTVTARSLNIKLDDISPETDFEKFMKGE